MLFDLSIWTPTIGETLICKREGSNAHDRYAVGCYIPDSNATLVGHVPKKIRFMCNLFLRNVNNRITCVISGSRRYSSDLIKGGMKIPCTLIFSGEEKCEIQKIQKLISTGNRD